MEYIMRRIHEDKEFVVKQCLATILGEGYDVDEEMEYQGIKIDEIDDVELANTVVEHDVEV